MTAERDDHWPQLVNDPQLGVLVGCICGKQPARRAARSTMQHTWHQTHRRTLKLRPVLYSWSVEAWDRARAGSTQPGEGGYIEMRGYEWLDGGWVQSVTGAAWCIAAVHQQKVYGPFASPQAAQDYITARPELARYAPVPMEK